MLDELTILTATAASVGVIHAALGVDHYLPFLAMARARSWSLPRTMAIASACGLAHVAASALVAFVAVAAGWTVSGIERFQELRGDAAGWLLLGFGVAYTVWGLRRAWRNRPHSHWHAHADGTIHQHEHRHRGGHAHPHVAGLGGSRAGAGGITPWVLFTIFVFGPCEALIPILIYPAARADWWTVVAVLAVFAAATLLTMCLAIFVGHLGLSRLAGGRLERYSHALAGVVLILCGVAIKAGL